MEKTMSQKFVKNEKARNLFALREEEQALRAELNEDRQLVHRMNMERRKRMQSEYKRSLVQDLMGKTGRAAFMEQNRANQVYQTVSKNQLLQQQFYGIQEQGAKTLQPVTIETHKKEYDLERKRKAKAKLEGAA